MLHADADTGMRIAYDTVGDPAHPAVLLVAGLGSQLISWHDDFCAMLAGRGLFVIRYDNRDAGLSTVLDQHPLDLLEFVEVVSSGDLEAALAMRAYSLADLAADGIALLGALGIDRAHVVGVSMGGMIVQRMAIDAPERLLTMTSIMSTTGERDVGQATPEARAALFAPRPRDRAGYVETADTELVWSSRRHADLDALRDLAGRSFDRGLHPAGTARQFAALTLDGSRAEGLAALEVPTLVVHGFDDTLVTPDGGRRTAELVPGARLLEVPDMGHDRPRPLWPLLVDAVVEHTGRA